MTLKFRPLACALCVLLSAGELRAQPTPDTRQAAEQKYQEGETQYKLQKYEEALTSFQESYALSKEPSILFNIAQCYRLLGRLEEAKKTYLSFLRDAPGSAMRANANARLSEIEAELKRLATKGSIQISSKQDPAEVFLNGELRGVSPLTLPGIEPGDHRITLKKQGFSNSEVTVSVKPSETSTLKELRLAPLALSPLPPRPYLLASGGLAGASALSFGGFLFFFHRAKQEQRDGFVEDQDDELQSIQQDVSRAKLAGFVSNGFAAGALVALGVGFWVKQHPRSSPTKQAGVSP